MNIKKKRKRRNEEKKIARIRGENIKMGKYFLNDLPKCMEVKKESKEVFLRGELGIRIMKIVQKFNQSQ